MKTMIYLFMLFFMSCGLKLKAQQRCRIDTATLSYLNGVTGHKQVIDDYRIVNNSDDEYLTWISLTPVNTKTNVELIRDFFLKRKHDFNLILMMNEDLLDGQPVYIGYSFIKNIPAGGTFSYSIPKDTSKISIYHNKVVLIKRKEVESYLNMQIKDKFFFHAASIVLTEK